RSYGRSMSPTLHYRESTKSLRHARLCATSSINDGLLYTDCAGTLLLIWAQWHPPQSTQFSMRPSHGSRPRSMSALWQRIKVGESILASQTIRDLRSNVGCS